MENILSALTKLRHLRDMEKVKRVPSAAIRIAHTSQCISGFFSMT